MPPVYDVPEIDTSVLDFSRPLADIDEIRRLNPHRYEVEMLTGILLCQPDKHYIVGFKETRPDDFWVRGHMPGFPLMPGVLMIEAAAQLCSFYLKYTGLLAGATLGLGGVEMAKFKRVVRPGERLVLVGHGIKIDRRLSRFHTVGYVNNEEAFRSVVIGAPLKGMGD